MSKEEPGLYRKAMVGRLPESLLDDPSLQEIWKAIDTADQINQLNTEHYLDEPELSKLMDSDKELNQLYEVTTMAVWQHLISAQHPHDILLNIMNLVQVYAKNAGSRAALAARSSAAKVPDGIVPFEKLLAGVKLD